jgi:hypothetical protein
MPFHETGVAGQIADTLNDVIIADETVIGGRRHAVGAGDARRERADAPQARREADVGDRAVGAA